MPPSSLNYPERMDQHHRAEQAARMILRLIHGRKLGINSPASLSAITTEFFQIYSEADLIAGINYAHKIGWLAIEGSDVRLTTAGLKLARQPEL